MEYFTEVQDGTEVMPTHLKLYRQQWLGRLKNGIQLRHVVTKVGSPKSHQQVKTHFGLCVLMIRDRMKELGIGVFNCPPSKDMVHEILTRCCMGVGDHGELIRMSSDEMTTARMAQVFENIRDFAASELHLVIPDPNPHWQSEVE